MQRIDPQALLAWATQHHAWLRVEQPVGAFVGEGNRLVSYLAQDPAATLSAADYAVLVRCVLLESHRSIGQDVGFGVQQLVDIALKVLSPGIKDTTTTIMANQQKQFRLLDSAKKWLPTVHEQKVTHFM